jgi:hypothetical protein
MVQLCWQDVPVMIKPVYNFVALLPAQSTVSRNRHDMRKQYTETPVIQVYTKYLHGPDTLQHLEQ